MLAQMGSLCLENPRMPVIRKFYIGEETLSRSAETGSISRFIFSGVIISKAHTMGLPCRNEGRENCVMHWHKFLLEWRRLRGTNKWALREKEVQGVDGGDQLGC